MLKRSSPRNCKMTFIKSENGPISRTEWNILISFGVNIDIDKIYRSRLCWAPNSEKVKMALSLELWRILWWNFAYTLTLKRCSQWGCQMIFGIVEVLPRFKFWKKWNCPYPLNLSVYFENIMHTHYYWHDLDRGIDKSSPRDCKMTFNIGRGCAELQILKKWKWPNWVDYCDETLHSYWYWQDVAQTIVKCHFRLAEALPRFKYWKTVKLALSLVTFWIFWWNHA